MLCSFGNRVKKVLWRLFAFKGLWERKRMIPSPTQFPFIRISTKFRPPLLTAIRFRYWVGIYKDWQPRSEEKKLPRHNPFSNHFVVTHEAVPPPRKLLIKRDDVSETNGALPCSQQRVTGPYPLSNKSIPPNLQLVFEIWSSSEWCVSKTFLFAYPFWLRKTSTDPHIRAVVYVVCLDGR